ncbi:tail fiber domain-containing protein [Bdellovibrio svalbardensis]|uniref:Tail fiber domain-containing protein n=1 Tax=Bdellovibrio svalbardensis TaxID=2972972 RepID=A0ABT6DMJ8_9BACT|nr:tail fiber domain-containing protein [Bdellovibrio svalbardensis]MDG0818099.1 tail fiber domain-containing protein [Bdellovibrio svalbardensis]
MLSGLKLTCTYLIGLFMSSAIAAPSSLTYQGRILKADNTPLEYNNVSFIFQVTDPSGACVIYQEQVNGYNMVNSGGVFDVTIGNGTVTYPTSGTFSILDAFNNSGTFACYGGSPYLASANDIRKLRVQFHDGVGWKSISPDSVIRTVPFAGYSLSAQKLGTNTASDFVLKTGIPTCTAGTFLSWDGATLSCSAVAGASGGTVTNVTSANSYVTIANGTSAPVLTLNVGTTANTVAAGNDTRLVNALQSGAAAGGDLSGNYPNPVVAKIQSVDVSSAPPTSGHFFKYNGTNWSGSAIAMADITGLNTQLGTYLTQTAFNSYVSSASCSTSQTMYWNSVSGAFACQAINLGVAGDVSGSIGAVSVNKIKGVTVDFSTAPTNGQVLQFNGSAFVGHSLTTSDISGTVPAAQMPAFTGDVTSSAGSTVLTLASTGTAGTYYKVTTDFKGRVTSGSNSLVVGDIPGLPWSQITSGKPTTLSGYGITDALIANAGGTPSIQTGLEAAKPSFGTAGRIYIATDTQKIYSDSGSAWTVVGNASGAGGTVTSVTSANADIGVATSTSTPVLTLNSGTGANQIVKLDGAAKLPAIDGSALINLNASNLASGTVATSILPTIPLTKGGTGLSAAGTSNQILGMNNAGTAAEFKTITAGSGVSVTHAANSVTIATTGAPPTGAAGGDLSGTYPNPSLNTVTVAKGGTGLTAGTSGGIPYFNSATTMASSAALTANGVLLGGGAGGSPTATSAGAAYQPLRVPSGGGAPSFGAIDISQAAAVTGILPIANGGTGASALAANRLIGTNGTGTVQQAVTCALNQILSFDGSGNYGCYNVGAIYSGFVNGGNSFGGASNIGNNDNFDLNIKTNNLTRMTVQAGGNVGIGTATPTNILDISSTNTNNSSAPATRDLTGIKFLTKSANTADGSFYSRGLYSLLNYKIDSGKTDTGTSEGALIQNLRNVGTTGDNGTLVNLRGLSIQYGHYGSDATATPTTTNAVGLYINPDFEKGTITNSYDVYLASGATGATTTNTWSYFQANSKNNYFGGNVGIATTPTTALDVNGVIANAGSLSRPISYSVPTATNVTINLPTGSTTLVDGYAYRFKLATQNTATSTGSSYIVYQTAPGTWASKLVSSNGNTSNHPLLQISGTNVQIYHNHGSTYSIGVISEAMQTGNITVLSPNYFGLDGAITNSAGNVGIGTTNPTQKLHVTSTTDSIINTYGADANQSGLNMGAGQTNRWMVLQETAVNGRFLNIWRDHTGVGGAVGSAMAITDAGNVGIGTISPQAALHLNPTITGAGPATSGTTPSTGLVARLGNSGGATLDHGMLSNGTQWMQATNSSNQANIYGLSLNPNGGSVGIGTSAFSGTLHVNSNNASGYTTIVNQNAAAGGQTWYWYSSSTGAPLGPNAMCFGNGVCLMTLFTSGNMSITGTLTQASDARYKKNVRSIANALDSITQLDGVTYNWIDPQKDPNQQIGLIAQDVEKVFPQAVLTNKQGYKSVAYQNLVAPIINALHEVRAWLLSHDDRLQKLETENEKLKQANLAKEKELSEIKARLERIEKNLSTK